MAERIEVGYAPAAFVGGFGVYHKYILYTNASGERFIARGGPGNFGPGALAGGRDEPSSSVVFKNIKTYTGVYKGSDLIGGDWDRARDSENPDPTATPHPRETIQEGADLSGEWAKIKEVVDRIGDQQIPYDPRSTNSNATVDEALREAGLPLPQRDGPNDNWSPGSGFDLPGGDVAGTADEMKAWNDFKEWFNDKGGWDEYFDQLEKDVLDTLLNVSDAANALLDQSFGAAKDWAPPRDPLTLDLDGDGIESVGISPSGPILFDHNADGAKTATGWIAPDDGLVVLDLNGNGQIDNGRELFGDNTLLPDGETAAHGYEALAQHDSNADGKIDAADAIYAELRIWQDANQDGISQTGELKTLLEVGIASISVAGEATQIDLGNGNTQPWSGSFTRIDGSTGDSGAPELSGSLLLASNNFYREFTDDPELTEVAQALPQMAGSGWVRDLREAMSLGTEQADALQAAVAEFSVASTAQEQQALLTGVIKAWAATTGRLVEGQGEYALVVEGDIRTIGTLPQQGAADVIRVLPSGLTTQRVDESGAPRDIVTERGAEFLARLAMLEAFNGSRFFQFAPPGGETRGNFQLGAGTVVGAGETAHRVHAVRPSAAQVELLEQAWESLAESTYFQLVLQTRLKPYLDSIELVMEGDEIRFDSTAMSLMLQETKATDPARALGDLVDLMRTATPSLEAVGFDAIGILGAWIVEWQSDADMLREVADWGVIYATSQTAGGDTAIVDVVLGLEGQGTLVASEGNDRVFGGFANDSLYGQGGDDQLQGGAGSDKLFGGAGHDLLEGGAGDDLLSGDIGDDLLDGGDGDDLLSGGAGNDTYLYGRDEGDDTIYRDYQDPAGKLNVLQFKAGVALEDVLAKRFGEDLLLSIAGSDDGVKVVGFFHLDSPANPSNPVQQVRFEDGRILDLDDIKAMALAPNDSDQTLTGYDSDDHIDGAGGDDVLDGRAGDDVLDGGTGDDVLYGGAGNDTHLFGRGDGADTISPDYQYEPNGTQFNVLQFKAGVAMEDVQVLRSGDHLVLSLAGTADQVTVQRFFVNDDVHHTGNPI